MSRVEFRPPSTSQLPAVSPPPLPGRRSRSRFALFGAVGAMGMAGSALVVAALAVLAAAGLTSLWVFRPRASRAEEQVLEAVSSLDSELSACRSAPGTMRLVLSVKGGRARQVEVVESTVDRRTERCVTRVLTKAHYPEGEAVTVEVPVVFR